ncbi:MAG TPA: hypothetical protein PK886_02065 [Candidatus Paceibacterota bacterium]|nr:hypothetical protein [Candidatus Paceibacterota bacterium]
MKKEIVIVTFMVVLITSCVRDLSIFDNFVVPMVIDYSKSVEQTVEENGYYFINSNISSLEFIKNETVAKDSVIMKREAIFLNFNCSRQSKDIVEQMKLCGFRPGTAIELYSLGEQYPKSKRGMDLVALGSRTKDSLVPGLCEDIDGDGYVCLWRWSRNWTSGYWFLAFRE